MNLLRADSRGLNFRQRSLVTLRDILTDHDWLSVFPDHGVLTQASFFVESPRHRILQTSRENVIEILAVRFESVPGAIEQAVESIEDLAVLKMLHKKAATVASMAEFESIINNL